MRYELTPKTLVMTLVMKNDLSPVRALVRGTFVPVRHKLFPQHRL